MNSAGSERMTVPPESTSRSENRPTAGLEARPDVASEPPHSTPTLRSASGHGARSISDAARTIRAAMRTPSMVIASAPPLSCNPRTSTGFPVARMRPASFSPVARLRLSTSTAATFGWPATPARVRSVTSKSAPICPRPNGVARTAVPRTIDAMRSALGLVLSIAERTATTLRTPTRPSARG